MARIIMYAPRMRPIALVIVIVVAFALAGCLPPSGAQQPNPQQDQRITQLEQRVTALEQYIRQMYDVLAANGALSQPANGGTAPTAPTTNMGPAPAPGPTQPPH